MQHSGLGPNASLPTLADERVVRGHEVSLRVIAGCCGERVTQREVALAADFDRE
jgi:hypothetical protein